MVTDRKIIASNGNISLELTGSPYSVNKISGFDQLDVQNVTSQGFDQDGASLLNSYVLPRSMKIEGQITASTTIQMQNLHDNLLNLFIPKKELVLNHYYGGKNRVIHASVEKTPKFEFTKVSTVHTYSIYLLATEPYWRDPSETLISIANLIGGFHFPLVIPKNTGVTFGIKSPSLIADAYNSSPVRVGMRIVFKANGSVSDPQLFNINTRKFIRLLCDMETGEQIVIRTGEDKSVVRQFNGIETDYIGKIDLAGGGNTFLELEPGDNLFRYAAARGENMLETRIYFYNKYLGV